MNPTWDSAGWPQVRLDMLLAGVWQETGVVAPCRRPIFHPKGSWNEVGAAEHHSGDAQVGFPFQFLEYIHL